MEWRLNRTIQGDWIIEYKKGRFSCWKRVVSNRDRTEPSLVAGFRTKEKAAEEMAKLMVKYG
ncbi:hypothetical protein ACWOAH_10430 [Vagococcus vulneris]|uniref:Uncharacterized protein n=1 Tax=Vagococcus vulneris TaxID=1977869 RepID=A0A429ZT94_9ENTE|nr:hypothetical protein [Vagococcus vulneris]RST96955.1 hypothetical protein CBF37_10385 [Vagococcus vulneris]